MTTHTEIRLWEAYFEQLPEFVEGREQRGRIVKRALLVLSATIPAAAGLFWLLNL